MAQSRLEKIGTIYTRTKGLMKSGALRVEDRPLWYDIYEAFPPKDEPRFDRPPPKIPLRKIFYEEDKYRAIFHRNNKSIGATNLLDTKYRTLTQRFIEAFRQIQTQYGSDVSEEQLYLEAIEMLKRQGNQKDELDVSLSAAFNVAQDQKDVNSVKLKIRDLFKD